MKTSTRTFKRRFIKGLVRSVEKEMLAKVPLMPKEWDGIELRMFISDNFRNVVLRGTTGRKRMIDYHNEIYTKNLI